jgi:Cdc6-like AAA superfamily ATPase
MKHFDSISITTRSSSTRSPTTQSLDKVPISLYGRSQEMENIERILKSFSVERGSNLLLLHGPAGSGKTDLLDYLKDQANILSIPFGMGSFEHQYFMTNQPQPTIGQTLQELMATITKLSSWESRKKKLRQLSNLDFSTLEILCPELKSVLHDYEDTLSISECLGSQSTLRRLHAAFCDLLQALSATNYPIMLVWDNFDAADMESLQFIQAVTSHQQSSDILIVLACREIAKCDSILSSIQNLWSIHKIKINPLSRKELYSLLETKYDFRGTDLDLCSQFVFKCTEGHRYHVYILLLQLEEKKRLRKTEEGNWMWESIETETSLFHCWRYLVSEMLQRIDENALLFLQTAAFIGNSFHPFFVEDIIMMSFSKRWHNEEFRKEDVCRILSIAVADGILEIETNEKYCFIHTNVVFSLISMASIEQTNRFHRCIGNRAFFYHQNKHSTFPNSVFIASDHLNQVPLLSHLKKTIWLH